MPLLFIMIDLRYTQALLFHSLPITLSTRGRILFHSASFYDLGFLIKQIYLKVIAELTLQNIRNAFHFAVKAFMSYYKYMHI